jgi:DnaJ-like protein
MAVERTLYEVLQVDPRAEPEVVEAAYRRLARKYHPDVSTAAGAEQRMKEINAAYRVLRDPPRRAAYDRELLHHAPLRDEPTRPPSAAEWQYDPTAQGLLACRNHAAAVAVGTCVDCGAGLCDGCFDRFQPPSCGPCILAWARQRRQELWLPAIWFLVVMGIMAYLFMHSIDLVVHSNPVWLVVDALIGYEVASYPTGWRVMRALGADAEEDVPVTLLLAAVAGPIVAPFRMGKIAWDLRQVGRLEQIARQA